MFHINPKFATITAFLLALGQFLLPAQNFQKDRHVEAALIIKETHLQPGETVTAGLLLKHAPDWHTYWKTTATGYATSLEWTLPEGIEAGEIQWPVPRLYDFQGFVEYVYEDETLLPVELRVSPDFTADGPIELKAKADWLMCEKTCMPGEVTLSLDVPVKDAEAEDHPEFAPYFEKAQTQLPTQSSEYTFKAWQANEQITLQVESDHPLPEDIVFFDAQALIKPTLEQTVNRQSDNRVQMIFDVDPAGIERAEELVGVLKAPSGWPGTDDRIGLEISPDISRQAPPVETGSASGKTGYHIILPLALLGGFILNLMPCVFPVLGIKIMGFVNQAGESRKKIAAHGLMFTLGVLVSFWILAIVLIALRASGQELGWGFQLQSPIFVYLLTVFLFLFGLNMSGLFEVGQSAVSLGNQLTGKSGLSGSFLSGVLATVVATPCAAPFLAPALGAAFALPPAGSLLVFTTIAIGLSIPYLLMSLFPKLIEFLPKPGAWMETFKQFMSFLLYATAGYLLWVLVGQLNEASGYSSYTLLFTIFSLVGVSIAAWVYGKWGAFHRKKRTRYTGYATAAILLTGSLVMGYPDLPSAEERAAAKVNWEKWEPGKAQSLAEDGKLVYVDFTARWCVTCQTNKATVFSSGKVRDFIDENNVVLLKADWTNRNPEITQALAKYNRSAVPFNLVYGPGTSEPIELPEILRPGTVLDALKDAK